MTKQRIIINLPDPGIGGSIMKGLNKRLSYIEDSIKKNKKKKADADISSLKHEIRVIKGMSGALASRDAKEIKGQVSAITKALSSLGSLRIPSPS